MDDVHHNRRSLAALVIGAWIAFTASHALGTETPFMAWGGGGFDCLGPTLTAVPTPEAAAEALCTGQQERLPACTGNPSVFVPPHVNGRRFPSDPFSYQFSCSLSDGSPVPPDFRPFTTGYGGVAGFRPKDLGKPCEDCVGNPIQIGTGNKFEEFLLYRGIGQFPIELKLHYNSAATGEAKAFGTTWRHSFERAISGDLGPNVPPIPMAWREDGKVFGFQPDGVAGTFLADSDVPDRITRLVTAGVNTGWRYVDSRGDNVEIYDAAGRLLSITNRAGLTQTLTYSDAGTPPSVAPRPGLLIGISDHFGRSLSFVYNAAGRVVSMADPSVEKYSFTYDAVGNLATVTLPGPVTRQLLYNEQVNTSGTYLSAALTGILDENGARFATFQYDSSGRAISSEHAGGVGKVTNTYDWSSVSNGGTFTTSTVDAFGLSRTLTFTSSYRKTRITSASGVCTACAMKSASQSFDVNGNVASRTDWNGNRTNYTYDLSRNLETSRTEGLTSTGAVTPQTRTISTQWLPNFRLVKSIAEPLRITTYAYNGDGGANCGSKADGVTLVPGVLCSKSIQATTDANGAAGFSGTPTSTARTWSYTYNAEGQVLTINGPRTDVSDVTTYTYYPANDSDFGKRGNAATITNAAGHVTSITAYNGHGQPLTIVDPNGLTTTMAYDARQRLTSRAVGGELTTYDYDGVGQLTKVTLPDGSFLSYNYDAAHRLTGFQDNLGNRIAYTLDAMGNRTQEQVFDPANSLAQTRSRVFNNLNRLFQEIGATGQTTEYAYDDQGNVAAIKNPLNNITFNQYDALNRLKQVTDPGSGVTQYGYNGLDALVQVMDPRSLVTGYTIDGLGNLTQQSSPDTASTTSTYDAAGNLLTQTDAKNQTTTYVYDLLNRVTLTTFQDGSKQAYVYDQGANGIGRLSSITERNAANQVTSAIAYAYEQHGRVTSETRTVNGVNYVLGYSYDAAGRLSGLTYPSGRAVTYGFDALGRVNQVTTAKGGVSQTVVQDVTYHPFGGVKGFTLGNSQAYTRGYDQDGRVASYSLGGQIYALGYDAASRIIFISDVGNPANSNTYEYDSLDRLIQATLPSTPFAYLYDTVGNRISKTVGSVTETYTYSLTSNRLSTISPNRTFGFDPNGSTVNDGLNSYSYDTRGRMVQATSAVGVTNYQINALGQRIRKSNSSTDTVFHYDTRGRLIAESAPGVGSYKRELIYLGDMLVGVVQ